jgi:hypothetical protein
MNAQVLALQCREMDDIDLAETRQRTLRWEQLALKEGNAFMGGIWRQWRRAISRELNRRAAPPKKSRVDFSMDAILGGAS